MGPLRQSYQKVGDPIKAKDSPWDAVLMGSVASTVNTKV
jgi:hypothetical protein